MIHSLVLYWCVHVFTFKLGAGAYAGCTYCCIKGEYSKNLQKIIYLDHRFFLPRIDSLRTTHKNFPSKSVPDHPPSPKTMDFVSDKITDLSKPMISRERKDMLQNSGCTGDYLRRLPFHDRFLNTPVEPMHLLKNISERIVTPLWIEGYTQSTFGWKGTQTVLYFMAKDKWRRQQIVIPPAPFSLSKDQLSVANQRSMNVKAPFGLHCKFLEKIRLILSQMSGSMCLHRVFWSSA